MDYKDETKRWHFNKEVSIGDLIAIVVAITAVLTSYFSLDKRVSVIEATSAANTNAIQQAFTRIEYDLRRLGDKMDRIVEPRK